MSTPASSALCTKRWLRGTHTDVPTVGGAVLHALELAPIAIRKWTACAALVLAICCCAPHRAVAQAPKDDKQSCHDFAQNFYDWYWNPNSDHADMPGLRAHSLSDVLTLKPPVLGPDLLKLLKQTTRGGRVGSLDFDPFLNSNAPHGKYVVSKVEVSGDLCRATIDAGHEIAALRKTGSSWLFVDFHYSYYYDDGTRRNIPDADLIQLLTS